MAIAIDIGKINAHGESAGAPESQRRQSLEMPSAVVYPDAVRREEVVADIDVRHPILIHVAKHNRQTPIPRNRRQRLSRLIHEDPVGPWNRHEMTFTVVQIQNIRLPQFEQSTPWRKFELVTIFRPKLEPAINLQ